MKDKILLALKAKFPKLSDARINALADKLANKVTEENDIDGKIDDLNDIMDFASIIKQDEKIAKLEAEKKEAKKKSTEPVKDEPSDEPTDEDQGESAKKERIPAYVKKMMEKLESLGTELAGFKSEKSQSTIKQKLADRLKEIPSTFKWDKWALPEKEEDIDAFVTEVETSYKDHAQGDANVGFSRMTPPKVGAGGQFGVKELSKDSAEVKAVVSKL